MHSMRSTSFTIALAAVAFAAGSCVKEDLTDCDGGVVVAVRDKNYDNAAEVGDVVLPDDLPARSYIATLATQNHPRDTRLYTPVQEPLADGLVYRLPPERLAGGVNELTVAGRGLSEAMRYAVAKTATAFTLHPDGREGEDIYLGGGAVDYPRRDDHTVWMLRTKGKLIVDVAGAPDEVEGVRLSVVGVRATVSEELSGAAATRTTHTTRADDPDAARLRYGGSVTVSRDYPSEGSAAACHLMLAPSASAASRLTITFTDGAGSTLYELGADVAIARNHITRVKAEYEAESRRWTLTVNVDGTWTKIENMTIS